MHLKKALLVLYKAFWGGPGFAHTLLPGKNEEVAPKQSGLIKSALRATPPDLAE